MNLLSALASRRSFSEENADLGAFSRAGKLGRWCAIGNDLQTSHAAENPENFTGSSLGVVAMNLSNFFAPDNDFEGSRVGAKKIRRVLRREVRDQVSEAVHLKHNRAQPILADWFRPRRGKL